MSRVPGSGRINKREEALHNLELARRQRLLPVQCWERKWVDNVYKWVKTDKKQEFSDDEQMVDVDEQQAPLRDEMEALAGAADQEVEELEAADRGDDGDSRAGSEEPEKRKAIPSIVDDAGTGNVTPAENGRSPMPPSPSPGAPPQTK